MLAALVGTAFATAACGPDHRDEPARYRMTIDELLLRDARTCSSGFEYPASLVDGIGRQLVEELRCMDDTWLEFYTPCREPGCIWADGPQPLAMRPEVIDALQEAAASADDFISITAAYRDVAMQYYSRWYKENCNASFDAAIPGESNHQGGRAIDVRYYDFWFDILLAHGFEHPIPTDRPHFELVGTAAFRAESAELQRLSITAFERLWNRNNPDDRIPEDGVYDEATKARLGQAPVEGFEIGPCAPGTGGDDAGAPDAGATDAGTDADDDADAGTSDAGGDASDDGGPTDVTPDSTADAQADPDDPSDLADGGDGSDADAADADSGRPGDANGDPVTSPDRDDARPAPTRPAPAVLSAATQTSTVRTRGCASARAAHPALPLCLAFAAVFRRRRG